MDKIETLARETPGVAHTVGIAGKSLILNANAPNLGSMYVLLEEFSHRHGHDLSADAISETLRGKCAESVRDAIVTTFGAPPIDGLGNTGGFKLIVEDRGNLGLGELQRVSDQIVARGNATPGLQGLFNSSRANTPWLYLDIDRTKCMALGVPVSDVFNTLAGLLRLVLREQLQRIRPHLASQRPGRPAIPRSGSRHPPAASAKQSGADDPPRHVMDGARHQRPGDGDAIQHVLGHARSPAIRRPGISSGQAIDMMQEIANRELPLLDGLRMDRIDIPAIAGRATPPIYVFALAVVFVFLVLAAQYESWALPLAVILVVPMCLLCSIVGVDWAGWTSTSSRRSALSCWWDWRARTRF